MWNSLLFYVIVDDAIKRVEHYEATFTPFERIKMAESCCADDVVKLPKDENALNEKVQTSRKRNTKKLKTKKAESRTMVVKKMPTTHGTMKEEGLLQVQEVKYLEKWHRTVE